MNFALQFSFLILSFFCFSVENQVEGIEYLYDQNEIYNSNTILASTSFIALEKDINNGLKNGIYWLKIPPSKILNRKLVIPNSHILKATLYFKDSKPLLPLKKESYITFSIPKTLAPIYVKITAEREAYIPIVIEEELTFLNKKFTKHFINGLYYGFTIMIFIVNLFYFISFREETFYYYLYALIFITVTLAFSDGTFNYLFSNANWLKKAELINQFFLVIAGYYFAYSYLELEFYIPKIKHVSILLITILLPLVVCYLVLDEFIFYVISEILVYGILGLYLICSFFLFNKSNFAKFFCLAYSIIFFAGLEYFIMRQFGFNLTNIKPIHLKIGGITEMLLISFAIVYRVRVLKKENEFMRKVIFEYAEKISSLKKQRTKQVIKIDENEFSKQELEIIEAISNEFSNKEIADKMFISVSTVKYHTKKIYNKLHVHSRKEIQNSKVLLS